jgi:putative transposase
MPKGLKRYYGQGDLHFITCSCYRRRPLRGSVRARNLFVQILGEVRARYGFRLVGYVVMPDHIHLLLGEPPAGSLSTVMQVLKQRVSRNLRRRRRRNLAGQMQLWNEAGAGMRPQFWQRRFYDFNVWSQKKRNEKLHYMHNNPVTRALVRHPKNWAWSSYRFYSGGAASLLGMDAG